MNNVLLLNLNSRTEVFGSIKKILNKYVLTDNEKELNYNQVARRLQNGRYKFDKITIVRKPVN